MKNLNFYEKVYQIVRKIPYGKVTTYGHIAAHLGIKSSSRMVGYAMNSSHSLADLPAHRVVNRKGILTGKFHFPTPTLMEELLENEGIRIKNDKIINLKDYLWIPEND